MNDPISKKTKICFIVRGINKGGGVERFVKNLIISLDKISFQEGFSLIVLADERYDFLEKLSVAEKVFIRKAPKFLWDNIFSYFKLRKIDPDVTVYLKNVIPPSNFFLKCKKINIVHDLAHFEKDLNAYKFLDTLYMKSMMKISCKKSNQVVAISQNTKNDIIKRFEINEDKVRVVYEAVEKMFHKIEKQEELEKVKVKYKLEQPFILYPGSISPRKNVMRMIQSFNDIKNVIPHRLYFTGSRRWNDEEIWEYVKQNDLCERVRKIGYVEEAELPVLYNLADLCLYPSLYEGFGLPILEAQACGCPILTSNTSSCSEVAGEGGAIVDPFLVSEISNGVKRLAQDKEYKKQIIEKGFENKKRFSWEASAKEFLGIIKELF